MEELGLTISVSGAIISCLSWLFKVWIINPLTSAINRLNDNTDEMRDMIDRMKEKDEETRKTLAVLGSDVKSVTERVNSLEMNFTRLQERQINILAEVKSK